MLRIHAGGVAVAAVLAFIASSAAAQDFFAGKTIELMVGAPPGGGYDIYGRIVARHLGATSRAIRTSCRRTCRGPAARAPRASSPRSRPRTAPSSPTSCRARSSGRCSIPRPRSCSIRPRSSISATSTTAPASASRAAHSKVKTFDDARNDRRAAFGGVSTNDSTRDYGYMHKKTSGATWNMITGYKGTADLALAVERDEIDGFCGFDWASLKSQRPNWVTRQDGQHPAAGRDRAE